MPKKSKPQSTVEKMVFPGECADMLGCRVALICAAKKILRIKRRKVFPSEIEKFLKDNPDFTESAAPHWAAGHALAAA